MKKQIFFLPVSLPLFIALLGLPFLLLAAASLLDRSPNAALLRVIGLPAPAALVLYLALLFAGTVNLPVYEFKSRRDSEQKYASYMGAKYPLPVWHGHNTVVYVNLGGCVVALLIAADFALALPWTTTLLAIAIVSLGVYLLSRPSRSIGFYVPALAPPALALAVALLGLHLSGGALYGCARLAFAAGTAGTLLGTTGLNLPRLGKLGSGTVSVGGVGAFDGIVLTGLLSTVAACLLV